MQDMLDIADQRNTVTSAMLDAWANDMNGPVGIHIRERLRPIEGERAVVFPPSYPGLRQNDKPRYQIDDLGDGTKTVTIDSVGSQANRMEPLFKLPPYDKLVPQIEIVFNDATSVSLLDVGHRISDASVRATDLRPTIEQALETLRLRGDASALARLAPTSLVFGTWDSRGDGMKLPRLVQSDIRAWDVHPLTRSAQYIPPVDYSALGVFAEEDKAKADGNDKSPLAQQGFVHVPSGGSLGGVVAHGGIFRNTTVNLIALRRLSAGLDDGHLTRRYILGLALIAATAPQDGFLRQGCLLTSDPDEPAETVLVERTGQRKPIAIEHEALIAYTREAAKTLGIAENRKAFFSQARAKEMLAQSKNNTSSGKGKGRSGKNRADESPDSDNDVDLFNNQA